MAFPISPEELSKYGHGNASVRVFICVDILRVVTYHLDIDGLYVS